MQTYHSCIWHDNLKMKSICWRMVYKLTTMYSVENRSQTWSCMIHNIPAIGMPSIIGTVIDCHGEDRLLLMMSVLLSYCVKHCCRTSRSACDMQASRMNRPAYRCRKVLWRLLGGGRRRRTVGRIDLGARVHAVRTAVGLCSPLTVQACLVLGVSGRQRVAHSQTSEQIAAAARDRQPWIIGVRRPAVYQTLAICSLSNCSRSVGE